MNFIQNQFFFKIPVRQGKSNVSCRWKKSYRKERTQERWPFSKHQQILYTYKVVKNTLPLYKNWIFSLDFRERHWNWGRKTRGDMLGGKEMKKRIPFWKGWWREWGRGGDGQGRGNGRACCGIGREKGRFRWREWSNLCLWAFPEWFCETSSICEFQRCHHRWTCSNNLWLLLLLLVLLLLLPLSPTPTRSQLPSLSHCESEPLLFKFFFLIHCWLRALN